MYEITVKLEYLLGSIHLTYFLRSNDYYKTAPRSGDCCDCIRQPNNETWNTFTPHNYRLTVHRHGLSTSPHTQITYQTQQATKNSPFAMNMVFTAIELSTNLFHNVNILSITKAAHNRQCATRFTNIYVKQKQ